MTRIFKKVIQIALISTSILLLINNWAFTQSEEIKSFHTETTINKNGTTKIIETITYDFGTLQKHGIYRKIPYTIKNQEGKKFKIQINIQNITDPKNNSYNYTTTTDSDYISVKIGDPDTTITGIHTYVITYEVTNALEEFSDHDELYWNITGNEWEVPINTVSAKITLPKEIPTTTLKNACYTGSFNSTETNCNYQVSTNPQTTTITYSSTKPFSEGEGMTIVTGFDKGYIQINPKQEVADLSSLYAILFFIWYILIPLTVLLIYFKYGRDPRTNTAIPTLFDPPQDNKRRLTPAETGTIIDESADNQDITATLVDLAIRGHLKITETQTGTLDKLLGKKEFILTKTEDYKTKDTYGNLQQHESLLLNALFKYDTEVNTKDLKDSFYKTSQTIKDTLYKNVVADGFFPSNPNTVRTTWYVIGAFALFTINIPFGIMCILCAKAMPRKTLKGARTQIDILGLKKFLTSQERQLNFQEENWYMFEKLLPYAIAFGVTEVWAKRFAHLGDMPQSSWYSGSSSTGTLNSYALASSLNSFNSSVASVATPTKSGSGFSSGFSGGFSGGGGGGGGGGSW